MGDVRFPEKNEDTALMERMLALTYTGEEIHLMLLCKEFHAAITRSIESVEDYFTPYFIKGLFSQTNKQTPWP
jgi:hypothetical protein